MKAPGNINRMEKSELGARLYEKAHLTGKFTLRSGAITDEYFDKYQFTAYPELLREVAHYLSALLPASIEVIAGLEMGGIPIATALSLETGIPVAFVRKQAKGYGTNRVAEGAPVEAKNVCLIEDIMTTGGQAIQSAQLLRTENAQIEYTLCVIERALQARDNLQQVGIELLSLFTAEELLQYYQQR